MLYLFVVLLSVIIPLAAVLVYIVFFLILAMVRGAVFVPSDRERVRTMVNLLGIKEGDRAIDVGSGDGRVVIEMAKTGAEAYGVEINPFLVLWSRYQINKAGLKGKAQIYWKNQWSQDFGMFNKVAVYGITYIMKDLEKKFKKELKLGSLVVSNAFAFPSWKPIKEEGEKEGIIRLYNID